MKDNQRSKNENIDLKNLNKNEKDEKKKFQTWTNSFWRFKIFLFFAAKRKKIIFHFPDLSVVT